MVRVVLLLSALLLSSCGGGSSSDDADRQAAYQQAVDAANAQQEQASALAVDTPCQDVSQCSAIAFLPPTGSCACPFYKPYSLVSASAGAASAAAAEQRALAAQAHALGPPLSGCLCAVPPKLACVASKCQLTQ
jgi:hypothetical protein